MCEIVTFILQKVNTQEDVKGNAILSRNCLKK